MYGANRLAWGILLVFIAGILFFFAFHPNGVTITDESGTTRPAQNPVDILTYLMSHKPGGGG